MGQKNYQRLFLRAPYKKDVLFSFGEEVFKASAENISEGGFLLELSSRDFIEKDLSFIFEIPEYPLFKNYTLEQLHSFSTESMHSQVIRLVGRSVREFELKSCGSYRAGFQIHEVTPIDQLKISKYIEHFASNLIFLQVLIDSLNSDEKNLKRIRKIANVLGYGDDLEISYLRTLVEQDYKSLQWL